MNLSEEETKEIENTAKDNPAVNKLWREYQSYQEDFGKSLYISLLHTVKCLEAEMQSISTGATYNKRRLLRSDSKEWKRVMDLLKNSKKIIIGLDAGRDLLNGEYKVIKNGERKESEQEISLTDRLANETQKK